jgi:hypothetical protein
VEKIVEKMRVHGVKKENASKKKNGKDNDIYF